MAAISDSNPDPNPHGSPTRNRAMSSHLQRACALMTAWQLCACGKIIGIEELSPPPIVRILPTTVHDELGDAIAFDELGVPVHTPGDRMVTLGKPGNGVIVCPVLHKFTHRLDDPNDNAIRWQFEVVSQGTARVDAEAGMYRLRLRQSPSDIGGDTEGWLTEWRPAQAIGTMENGVRYEAVVLRSQIPSLTAMRGVIEFEFRGANELGVESVPVRYCWQHVPLAAPLQVRNVVEATGPGSLHETNLDPGNNLAPLLEGVPLEQGRAVMELEIVNGTAEAVYATLAIEQDQATFTRSWQKTNAFLIGELASDCLGMGECTLGFPSDRWTVLVTEEAGTMDGAVNGLAVEDTFTRQRISPCESCDPNTYLIEPRATLGDPRVYRVRLLITDLRMLTPQLPGMNLDPFADMPLDAEMLLTSVTGQTFGRFRVCEGTMDGQSCVSSSVYQHYVALTEASLTLPRVHIAARTSPSPELPAIMPPEQPGVLGAPVGVEAYHWSTVEEALPVYPEPVAQP
jgi:hypothetical protein